jgi:hypothetical protein
MPPGIVCWPDAPQACESRRVAGAHQEREPERSFFIDDEELLLFTY